MPSRWSDMRQERMICSHFYALTGQSGHPSLRKKYEEVRPSLLTQAECDHRPMRHLHSDGAITLPAAQD